jgi:hypothetical protein
MRFFIVLPIIAATFVLGACSAGSSSSPDMPAQNAQTVTGTLAIGFPPTVAASSARKPAYVSSATQKAYVFINGGASPANSTTTCTGTTTTGTGTFCTLSWSASLPVPGSYFFAVDTTDSAGNVLATGGATYAIVSGVNTLATLTLNGVAAKASFATSSCSNTTLPGNCTGTITITDFDSVTIEYTGSLLTAGVVTPGNSPSTGTVFDNAGVANGSPVTFTSSNSTVGKVTGTAQTTGTGPYVFSSFASNTLTTSGVISAAAGGDYTFAVSCSTTAASGNGTFGFTIAGGTSPSGAVTAAQRANETPAGTYPTSVTAVSAPSYTCTAGAISSATGTLPIN